MRLVWLVWSLFSVFVAVACGSEPTSQAVDCTEGQSQCWQQVVETCSGGTFRPVENCAAAGQICAQDASGARCQVPEDVLDGDIGADVEEPLPEDAGENPDAPPDGGSDVLLPFCHEELPGTPCDDSDPCTYDDVCSGGAEPACAGTSYSCSDGLDCTEDACDGQGACNHPVASGYLLVDGACVKEGDCAGVHDDGIGCFRRWDIQGFYYAVGQTLTESQDGIAVALLPENDVTVVSGPAAIPAGANLVEAHLYWSGARAVPDTAVELRVPGQGLELVVADKCYADDDNRIGSISKSFYTCRADVTAMVAAGDGLPGLYTVGGVDAVILPGGNACTSTKACYEAANAAAGTSFTSCIADDGIGVCACNPASSTCSYGQSTVGHASFSLVFVYEHGEQSRTVLLYDGMQAFIAQALELKLDDFETATAGETLGALSYYVVEGDNDDVTMHSEDPEALKRDNPGEKVTLSWGDENGFNAPQELHSEAIPLWEDPFDGTTGVGTDIETLPLQVPAGMTRAKVAVHSPNVASVTSYPNEVCTNPTTNDNCAEGHQCACLQHDPGTQSCAAFGCIDSFANDGIGLAYIVLGFDSETKDE